MASSRKSDLSWSEIAESALELFEFSGVDATSKSTDRRSDPRAEEAASGKTTGLAKRTTLEFSEAFFTPSVPVCMEEPLAEEGAKELFVDLHELGRLRIKSFCSVFCES